MGDDDVRRVLREMAGEFAEPHLQVRVVRIGQLRIRDLVTEPAETIGEPVLPVVLGPVVLPAVEDEVGGHDIDGFRPHLPRSS